MNVFCRHPTDISTLIWLFLYDRCWTNKILQVVKIKEEVIITLKVAYFLYQIFTFCQHNELMHLPCLCASYKIMSWFKTATDSWWSMCNNSLLKQTSWNTVWVPELTVGMLLVPKLWGRGKGCSRMFENARD